MIPNLDPLPYPALAIETNLDNGVDPFVFGVVLSLINLTLVCLALAVAAWRYRIEERAQGARAERRAKVSFFFVKLSRGWV